MMEMSALPALRHELRAIRPGHSNPLKWSNKRARFRHTGQGHPGARARSAPARYPGPGGAENTGRTAPARYRPKSGRVRGARPGCKTGAKSLSAVFCILPVAGGQRHNITITVSDPPGPTGARASSGPFAADLGATPSDTHPPHGTAEPPPRPAPTPESPQIPSQWAG